MTMTPEHVEAIKGIACNALVMIPVIAAAVALVVLLVICAFARIDESCDPEPVERHCGNCGRYDQPTYGECASCCLAYPDYPQWIPRRKDGGQ